MIILPNNEIKNDIINTTNIKKQTNVVPKFIKNRIKDEFKRFDFGFCQPVVGYSCFSWLEQLV